MIDKLYSLALFFVMNNQFLNLNDLSKDKLENIFDISLELKQNPQNHATQKINFGINI